MDIKTIFDAEPENLKKLLCQNGLGLYIPAYQRGYAWDKDNIYRLFEDACHGFTALLSYDDAVCFLGTIIMIHDTKYQTVSPIVRKDVPSRVMTVIDGQQRLTTLLLTFASLHDQIRLLTKKFEPLKKGFRDDTEEWIYSEARRLSGTLSKAFQEEQEYAKDQDYKWYPRMARAYDDSWSHDAKKACYSSPIARFLFEYGGHERNPALAAGQFKFVPGEDKLHKDLAASLRHVVACVTAIADGGDDMLNVPSVASITNNERVQLELMNDTFPGDVRVRLSDPSESRADQNYRKLLRLVLFGNFLFSRVAITTVTATNEDFAFDMFESLNTTGEPLTAFETFRPRVIEMEGSTDYETSPSRRFMKVIAAYLDSFGLAKRHGATTDLLIAFALFETGEKRGKKLSDQRRYLRTSFDSLPSAPLDDRRAFVEALAHTAIFMRDVWSIGGRPVLEGIDELNAETCVCLDLLRRMKHNVAIAPLARYYSEYLGSSGESVKAAKEQLESVVKALTAFSVLWRTSRRGTARIDGMYRALMESGAGTGQMKPLRRRGGEIADTSTLRASLRRLLDEQGGIVDRESWVRLAVGLPAYSGKNHLARFLLLAAAHDTVPDDEPGLLRRGKENISPLLVWDVWDDEATTTVEHIAPQTAATGWSSELYEDAELVHQLGNLTLLPAVENASMGNRPWKEKRLLFEALSAPTPEAILELTEQAAEGGMVLSQSTTEILQNSKYLPMTRALAAVKSDWTVDLVQRRSRRIAELAWDTLAPWLGY